MYDDDWRVSFSGIAWRTPVTLNRRQRLMVRMLGNVMKATPEQLRSEMFERRIHPFMAGAFKKLPIAIGIGGRSFPLRKPTRRNGRFEDTMIIPSSAIDAALSQQSASDDWQSTRTISFDIHSREKEIPLARGTLFLIPRFGVSVISDIDDTIKDSQVGNRRELLANTFLREFRSIEGMAEVYQQWATQGAAFHYVSSSPWQLFDALKAINTELGFPHGTMHLRNFRLRDQILNRFIVRRRGKAVEIQKLAEAMPDREFILIGDSGEKDPRIYRKICRKYPDRVRGVFIRSVDHKPFQEEHTYKLAKSLPQGVVAAFRSADELLESANQLILQ
ncbi:MAG: App1 family protein [Planctomycetota bacterium]